MEIIDKSSTFPQGNGKVLDKLAWICIRDHHVLFVRSRGNDTFYTPGGKREKGESDQDALIREIREECGVLLFSKTIRYLETFKAQAHGKPEGVEIHIACYTADYEGELTPSNEIEEFAWFEGNDSERTTTTGQLILNWLKERNLI